MVSLDGMRRGKACITIRSLLMPYNVTNHGKRLIGQIDERFNHFIAFLSVIWGNHDNAHLERDRECFTLFNCHVINYQQYLFMVTPSPATTGSTMDRTTMASPSELYQSLAMYQRACHPRGSQGCKVWHFVTRSSSVLILSRQLSSTYRPSAKGGEATKPGRSHDYPTQWLVLLLPFVDFNSFRQRI